jgi:hypothetical protein
MHDYAVLKQCLLDDLSIDEPVPFFTSDMDLSTVRSHALASAFLKKNVDVLSPEADKACLDLFLSTNQKCAEFSFKCSGIYDDRIIGEVTKIFDDMFFHGPDLAVSSLDFEEALMVGPGASLGAQSYNFYSKLFDSPLTSTNGRLLHLYRRAIKVNPSWSHAEQLREARFGTLLVGGNRLSFVPKTSAISRSICTEPSLNMLFQKGLGTVLERLLDRHFKIDLSVQPELNRGLAMRGSLDGAFGTIDLKSASDSMSLGMLKSVLPPYLFRWLMDFRSPSTTLPGGEIIELHMVSSMGNGFTFPLQTMLFAVIVRACYRLLGIKLEYSGGRPSNFGVFGDDIIVRKDAYEFVTHALRLFGFVVNTEKSFNTGPFRESCGGDFFKGSNVRGVYCKSLSTRADVYSTINRLTRWCSVAGIVLHKTLSRLCGLVPFLPVPFHAGDTEGVKVPLRFNSKARFDKNGSVIYYALLPVARNFRVPADEAKTLHYPDRKVAIGYNPGGLAVSLVGGFIRNGRITLRSEELVRYKVRRRKTPHWGHYDSAGLKDQVRDWEIMYELMAHSCLNFARP